VILIELRAIGVNLLFGAFFYIIINTFSLYEVKVKSKVLSNLLYFVFTIFCGIIYIVYLDVILFDFNFYYLLFIALGFYIAHKSKYLKTEKYIKFFNYLIFKLLIIIKKVFLFLINYSFWSKIKIKKKIKDK
jgi:hypothetical protein